MKDTQNSTAEFNTPRNVANRFGNLVGIEVPKSDHKDLAPTKYNDDKRRVGLQFMPILYSYFYIKKKCNFS